MKQISKIELEVSMSGITRYLEKITFAQIRLRISYFLAIAAMSINFMFSLGVILKVCVETLYCCLQ